MEIQTIQNILSVLIIEDNAGDIRLVEETLKESAGYFYKVTSSCSLKEGTKILNENKFDVLILDLRLPDSSDLETLKLIREINSNIPIIVLTIQSNEELGLAAIRNGAQDFLIKEELEAASLEKSIKFAVERKKLEQKISSTENLFEVTFEQAAVGMAHLTIDGKFLKINQKCCEIFGYDKEELIGRSFEHITHKNDRMSDYKQLNQLLKGDILNYQIEKRVIKKDDSIIWIHITRSLIKQNEKQPIIFTVIEDVNLKKRTENILTQAFENYKNLAENSPDIIYRFDRNLNCLYTNPSVSRISGRGPEERIGRNLSDFAKPEQFTAWQKRFEKVIETKKREYYQDILRTLEGEKTIETIFVPEFDLERNITSFLTLSRDITERIHAQEEIQRKNILLEKILDNIPAGVWIIDEKGSLMMYNKACELIWGGVENLSIRKKPQLNAWWADTGKKIEDNEWGSYKAYTQGETSLNEIINIETSNGIKKTIMNSAVPMFDNNKKIIGVVVINQDISKLMKIENDLKNSLAEKEMLMKEIHHRVKNNFQIIASLLNLQRTSVKNRNIEDVLLESQNRINSMAILHEKLYKSKNFQKINFAVYLKGLIKSLESSYKTGEKDISLIFDIDELFVSTDYAINLGLIINELVSNSLKHAFKDKNKGTVAIFLKKEKNDLQLTVKDDGVGISKEFDIKNTESLGMLLINSFVEQIKGKTELNCECGTEFKIVFPKERE